MKSKLAQLNHTLRTALIIAAATILSDDVRARVDTPQDFDCDGVPDVNDLCPYDASQALVVGPCGCLPPPLQPIKIMLLGDSITVGPPTLTGFRTKLFFDLTALGYDVDFLGSVNLCGQMPAGTMPCPPLPLPDTDHEGHGGYTIESVTLAPGSMPAVSSGLRDSIGAWLNSTTPDPDVILLQVGTNDIRFGKQPGADPTILSQAPFRLKELVKEIFLLKPNVKVVLSTIPPRRTQNAMAPQDQDTIDYNTAITDPVGGVFADLQALMLNVILIDNWNVLDSVNDFADPVHPNQGGYHKLAANWLTAFDPVGIADTAFCFGDGGDQSGCTACPCGNDAALFCRGGCLNSAGNSSALYRRGVPSVMSDTLGFEVRGAPPKTLAILVSGNNTFSPMSTCLPGRGIAGTTPMDGLRCVGYQLIRHGGRITDSYGDTGVTNSPWGYPTMSPIIAGGMFTNGQTRLFQCWYRDLTTRGCGTGLNTSNAIAVTFQP